MEQRLESRPAGESSCQRTVGIPQRHAGALNQECLMARVASLRTAAFLIHVYTSDR